MVKITKLTVQDYSDSKVLNIDADKETINKVLKFIADLQAEVIQSVTDKTDKQNI